LDTAWDLQILALIDRSSVDNSLPFWSATHRTGDVGIVVCFVTVDDHATHIAICLELDSKLATRDLVVVVVHHVCFHAHLLHRIRHAEEVAADGRNAKFNIMLFENTYSHRLQCNLGVVLEATNQCDHDLGRHFHNFSSNAAALHVGDSAAVFDGAREIPLAFATTSQSSPLS
jgi:hypothetical protein